MNTKNRPSTLPVILSSLALVLSACALAVSIFNQYQQREQSSAVEQTEHTALMAQFVGTIREHYPEADVMYSQAGATVEDLNQKMEEGSR